MKVLIIDDNHSFIDLLKNALKPFRFHMESYYRFSEARETLQKNGCYLNQGHVYTILKYNDAVSKSGEKENPRPPLLNGPLINPNGYALVFLEYDAEASLKGTHFIQEILRNHKEWSEKNFILLSSNPDKVEPLARKMKVAFAEKPVKKEQLMRMVQDVVRSIEDRERDLKQMMDKYGILEKIEPDVVKRKTREKKAAGQNKKPVQKKSKALASSKTAQKTAKKTPKKAPTKTTPKTATSKKKSPKKASK